MKHRGFLPLIVVARVGASALNMAYAGSIPFLLEPWRMSGAEAGAIQSAFNLAYAISLLVCSWASDKVGPGRIFACANWAAALLFVACAFSARSFESGLLWFTMIALALGGSYTPALMLIARAVSPERRGAAVGWILAGSSLGYFGAIAAGAGLIPLMGYERFWLILAPAPLVAALAASVAMRGQALNLRTVPAGGSEAGFRASLLSRKSLLLTGGYTAHCWELLGMWAWAPAFLTLTVSRQTGLAPLVLGVLIAGALHLSGAGATLIGGIASDRLGRKRVLVVMAAAGACLSFLFGWSAALGPAGLLLVAMLYGFATIGDSGVLSTAMTEAVPPAQLGSMLALRSILGFGAGAISPLAMGWVLDLTNPPGAPPEQWGWAFALLGLGGLIAAICAGFLPADTSMSSRNVRT